MDDFGGIHDGKTSWTALKSTGSNGTFITVIIPDGTKYYGGYGLLRFITVYYGKNYAWLRWFYRGLPRCSAPDFQCFNALFQVLGNLGSRPQPQKPYQDREIQIASSKMSIFSFLVSLFQKQVFLPICGLVLTSFRVKCMPAPW